MNLHQRSQLLPLLGLQPNRDFYRIALIFSFIFSSPKKMNTIMAKRLLSLALAVVTFATIAVAELPGKYELIIPNIPPSEHSLDKVNITEFFSFTCGHCYNFHKNAKKLKEKFGDKIQITPNPVGWYGDNPGRLYFIGKKFGKGELVIDQIFNFVFEQSLENIGQKIFQREMLKNVALITGLTKEFNTYMDDPEIIKSMNASIETAKNFNIHSTPTIVIEGAIKTSGNIENLERIINALLKNPVK